jgi:hypothetical protein
LPAAGALHPRTIPERQRGARLVTQP